MSTDILELSICFEVTNENTITAAGGFTDLKSRRLLPVCVLLEHFAYLRLTPLRSNISAPSKATAQSSQ